MGIDRIATYNSFLQLYGNVSKVDAELANLQNQISSGRKSQNFAGIASDASQFLQLDDKINRNEYYLKNNSIIRARIDSTSNVLSQVISSTSELKNLILQRRASSNDVGVFGTQLESIFKAIAGQMNTSIDGRYLFSGGRTDVKAVDDVSLPVLSQANTPDAGYYQGDNRDLTVNVSENVSFAYNVRANEEGFQKIFAGIAIAKEAEETGSDAKFAAAYDLLDQGIREVASIQAKVNSNKVALDNVEENITSLQTYWKGVKEGIGNTDIIAATTQVAIHQGILQATFQVFARITSLRLSDYLR